ncbi:hypothetical protein A3J13_02010 [Candidatus Daviesbacteria bacterium RIFCSPLOWO2_02_FULL_36_8]|uniref:peptidylprolyl isomerase n=1 Tax=Candidatus Daviesbacteria bacterium RIFCSPLOWO2_02_FULL_36_8 TaxID=1797793 RepID=A0A1F5MGG3_9BACT|nr:MAG: hypothetical protein A3J13_02010 [Candidatus Daviesbacteria bacterium RIFCSPLOWO2_02_FULL_36_8]
MPRKATRLISKTPTVIPGGKLNNVLNNLSGNLMNLKSSKKLYLGLIISGVLLLAIYKKNWFVAATVNGSPISNLELQTKLNAQFKTQILTQMINEKIIMDEARKGSAIPTEEEVNQKIKELETQVGGAETLDMLLSQQGQSRSSLKDQVRVQLAISKLYINEATVSAEEVTSFIATNKDQLKATDSAAQEIEATDALKQQKLSEIFTQKFQDLRSKAKIQIF